MEFLSNKPLLITDTILRDAHQSQAATRMTLEQMLPACEVLDSIGYYSLECWGGATFDACLRFLDEDPWERLRQLRAHLPHTKLQMLFRGQNILGYKHYADDVVDEFCGRSIENGIDIIRIFDALNDVRNLEQAIKSTKKYGGQVEATLSYTISPIHNEDYFVKLAKELEQMGADALCIKDMANLLLPMDAYSLVKRLKETVGIPIHLHTHNTSGTGDMVNLMAAMAGVDIVDTALSPLANGTSQPATESLVATLKGTPRDTGLDLDKMSTAAVHFRKVADELKASGALDPKVLNVDTNTLLYQVPGGMLSNLRRALQDGPQGVQGHAARRIRQAARQGQRRGTRQGRHQARGRHHLPPRRPFGAGASEVPRGIQGPCKKRGGRALSRALPAGRPRVHQPPQSAHAQASPHGGAHRASCKARARRCAVLPQVNRIIKTPFRSEGRFSCNF